MDLTVEAMTVRFGRVTALDGVDVSVPSGQVFVLAGPNGAGKSTLMSVVLGLIRPDTGRVRVNGQVVASPRRATSLGVRERIGYLPEAVAFSDNLSGWEVLRFFARARGVPRQRIDAVLERVGLTAAGNRAVRGYSRGMRQRLGLGVAILAAPDLLVLDEPTGGLDQEGLGVLWDVVAEWRAAGRLVVMSTHDLTLVERRADALCVLRAGRVCALGSPIELRRRADLPVRVRLELDGPEEARRVAERLGGLGASPVGVDGPALDVPVSPRALAEVLRAVHGAGAPIRDFRVEEPGLDEVYAHLLRGGPEWDASRVH